MPKKTINETYPCDHCGGSLPTGQREGKCPDCNRRDADVGHVLLTAYARISKLNPVERAQDYTVTDAIVALLKYARSKNFDVPAIHASAISHYNVEEAN
jgi:predicted ATP-dependent serine protease